MLNLHLLYACEIWKQNQTNYHFKKLLNLQEIDFKQQTSPSDSIHKENKIHKISDFVSYKYVPFV